MADRQVVIRLRPDRQRHERSYAALLGECADNATDPGDLNDVLAVLRRG